VKIEYDATELRPKARYVDSNWSHLSAMTTREEWGYDDFGRVNSARTRWSSFNDPNAPNLVLATASWDTLGRLEQEGFQWADAAGPVTVKSGWDMSQSSKDPSFRRSLTTASGFVMTFLPDNAGKLMETHLKEPGGSSSFTLAKWRFEGGRVLGRRILFKRHLLLRDKTTPSFTTPKGPTGPPMGGPYPNKPLSPPFSFFVSLTSGPPGAPGPSAGSSGP